MFSTHNIVDAYPHLLTCIATRELLQGCSRSGSVALPASVIERSVHKHRTAIETVSSLDAPSEASPDYPPLELSRFQI
jgi:hypothetical protein